MALQTLENLQVTLRELRQIIVGISGEQHESSRLAGQMEDLAAKIERKASETGSLPVHASETMLLHSVHRL